MSDPQPEPVRRRVVSSPRPPSTRAAGPLVDPNELAGAMLELGRLRLERDDAVRELLAIRVELDEVKSALAHLSTAKDADERAGQEPTQ